MCRVKFCSLELIFDLLLQTLLLIPRTSTNNCRTKCRTVPSDKGMFAFDFKFDIFFKSLFRISHRVSFIAYFSYRYFTQLRKKIKKNPR